MEAPGRSDEGNFFALDAETGEVLWHLPMGFEIRSNPITYEVEASSTSSKWWVMRTLVKCSGRCKVVLRCRV